MRGSFRLNRPGLCYLTASFANSELSSANVIKAENFFFGHKFAAVYCKFRRVKQKHIRLRERIGDESGNGNGRCKLGLFGFADRFAFAVIEPEKQAVIVIELFGNYGKAVFVFTFCGADFSRQSVINNGSKLAFNAYPQIAAAAYILVIRLTAAAYKQPAAVAVAAKLIDKAVGKPAVCKAESYGAVILKSIKKLSSVKRN